MTMTTPLSVHLSQLPASLVAELQKEFQKLHQNYFLSKWQPSQLDGALFCEAIYRILEYKDQGGYTRIGFKLNRFSVEASIRKNKNLPESVRLHVLKLLDLVFDFRNKRSVGHLGIIDVNEMDATMVLQCANWIVAELIRLETSMSPEDAQNEIKKIIERKVPIVEEIGGRLKCLNPGLKAWEQALVLCYQKYPEAIALDDLFNWIGYSNKGVLRSELAKLDKDGRLDFRDDRATLTKKGIIWVEKYISFEIVV
ncbi:MAG: hypothetical protein A2991_02630 [Candidatus Terrybacteria bacterium RIFCSPLOWO2_01_FULL_58_14]|uniref:Uncharacterized protein n=1 Tax=Candidatus Terrybacteria bacterium RIFCSPLOWO2_01_FULL_58_14 TaxID=1802369 RepID=A0A1G2Q0N7_9BACT|nr:MAG: hypothetical protein A2991_02630 [Candidatus Terrybacteria bacterium RIFCSPLOWO2_01_FULL_58_14]